MNKKSVLALTMGLGLLLNAGTSWSVVSSNPTLSSVPPANQQTTSSNLTFTWTEPTSDRDSISYQYMLTTGTCSVAESECVSDGSNYKLNSFIQLFGDTEDTSVIRRLQLSDATQTKLELVPDGTYYFHLQAFDADAPTSGSDVVSTGPIIINSTPSLSSGTPISPSSGDHTKLVNVTISGSRFISGATVDLVDGDTTVALSSVIWKSSTQLTANVPADIAPGTYDLQVTNGQPNRKSVYSVGAYTATNQTPTAAAGDDVTVNLSSGSATISLDGSSSSDPDSDTISSYTWTATTVPSGSTALSEDQTSTGSTWETQVSTAGVYEFSLVVSDGYATSTADSITVTVRNPAGGNPPTANAGTDQVVRPNNQATLSGSQSEDAEDGTTLTYTWALTSAPSGSSKQSSNIIQPSTNSNPSATFTPDVAGSYVITLTVTDSDSDTDSDSVTLTVNNAPVASAGDDQSSIATGTQVTLNGSASTDADSDTLTYLWSVDSSSEVSSVTLSSTTAAQPTFTPTARGTYVFNLVVNDGTESSSTDQVSIIVTGNSNPVADAGNGQTVSLSGGVVTLDGTASNDPDSDTISYAWEFTSVPSGSTVTNQSLITTTNAATPTFEPDVTGTYYVKLTVTDDYSTPASATDTVQIVVSNTAPTANATASESAVQPDTEVTISDNSSADVDENDYLSAYSWNLTNVPDGSSLTTGVLGSGTASGSTSVTIDSVSITPDVEGTFTVTLTVTDSNGVSGTKEVVITASAESGNSITHTLYPGLNIVPYTVSDSRITTAADYVSLLTTDNPSLSITLMFGWTNSASRSDGGEPTVTYIPALGQAASDFDMEVGKAYVVVVGSGTGSSSLTGTSYTSISLGSGLNLVGSSPSTSTIDTGAEFVSDLETQNSSGIVTLTFSWIADENGGEPTATYIPALGQAASDFSYSYQAQGLIMVLTTSGTYAP
ncbi:MAG: hypothetical protein HQL54_01270 [Magnetococcales bacterium]|nr:hypothetical protein [Magnetococcales bacterium]